MQTLRTPLRRHVELIEDEDDEELKAIDEKAAAVRADFEVVDGLRVGRPVDIRTVEGKVRGPIMNEEDTEPSDAAVDTGFEFKNFSKGAFWL